MNFEISKKKGRFVAPVNFEQVQDSLGLLFVNLVLEAAFAWAAHRGDNHEVKEKQVKIYAWIKTRTRTMLCNAAASVAKRISISR